ncbi:hypothetical protein SK128_011916, partial [Halocaridina rubra]
LDWGKESIQMICCKGKGRITQSNVLSVIYLRTWMHVCLAVDLALEKYHMIINSEEYSGTVTNLGKDDLEIEGNGTLILGQEQDTYNGGFNIQQTYEGKIAQLLIFPKFLQGDQLKKFTRCDFTGIDDASVSFQSLEENWEVFGSVEKYEVNASELCSIPRQYHVIFPEHRSLEESKILCRMLKGHIALPKNEEENQHLTVASLQFMDECAVGWGFFFLLGLKAEIVNNSYQYVDIYTNNTVSYTSFRQGYDTPTDTYRCVYMDTHETGKWGIYPCDFKSCIMCTFKELTILRLRGLCQDSTIDRKYFIHGMKNNKPAFEGLTNSKIYWNNSSWVLEDQLNIHVKGKLDIIGLFQYPFGLHSWNITGDKCPLDTQQLLLTACRSDQYTCNDGTCIRKMQRCDLEINCPDKSDENNCTAVIVPYDYIKEVPPARVGNEPASITLHVSILSLQPIDTLNMKISFDINVTLMWKDPRLDMLSLNYAETLNVIQDGNAIWQPEFLFEDFTGSEADVIKRWQTFVAVMQSGPLPDDITRVKEDEVYPGTENSLKLTETYFVKVSCQMKFGIYPFDTQHCYFKIRLQYFTRDLVVFKTFSTVVEYLGARTLREYAIRSVTMIQEDWNSYSGFKVTISLDNLSGFHITTTYIPTFLMVIIAYSTLFFDLDDFNDRIMVSLTALLVLATLFTQISETTPRTSYLKLLDVWFVATIFMNFAIVILLVVINFLKMKETRDTVTHITKPKFFYPVVAEKSRKLNTSSQVAIPVILGILILVYIGIAQQE